MDELTKWVSVVKDIFTIFAACVACFVGLWGLRTWRRQPRGNADHELARRLLRATYRVRDGVRGMRPFFVSGGEIYQAMKEAGVGDSEMEEIQKDQNRVNSFLFQKRGKVLNDALREFGVEVVEAEALWGEKIRKVQMPLMERVQEINWAINSYLTERPEPLYADPVRLDQQRKHVDEYHKIVFPQGSNDAFSDQLDAAVAGIASYVRPFLIR